MQDPSGIPLWDIPFCTPKRHPIFAMRICQNKYRVHLLPLVRSDDLRIEAREVLVDLVLAAVVVFL